MLLTAQVLISLFIFVADADFLTDKSMQGLQDPAFMDWNYQKTSFHLYNVEKVRKILKRLENCCSIRCVDYKKKEHEVEKECEDFLVDKLGGKENLAKARQAYPKGVYMCTGLCMDQKLGVLDSSLNIKKDAARQYLLSLYESKIGKEEAGKKFERCFERGGKQKYRVVKDKSITCPALFRGVFECVRKEFLANCPRVLHVETDECDEARQDLIDEKESG